MRVHRGHLFHLTGRPSVNGSADALVPIPDGALAVDAAGRIVHSGPYGGLSADLADWPVRDHRP